ncbi:MAG: hypothetical protein QNK04_04840 [Myxococcota bacterium]|nr:hypothetical protein [Myxococcota bacterium]
MTASIATVSRSELLARLHALVRRGNAVEAELLEHLAEVDARRLYLEEGCNSMFAYCLRVLHFAEGVAYKRIQAARAARRHPAILAAVRRGELHVTGVSLLAPRLDSRNAAELIQAARHRSADEIRRLLADREPRPDVPASARRVPTPARPPAPAASATRALDTRTPVPQAPAAPLPPARPRTEPLGGERYHVQFTADRQVHEQLQELKALLRHQIPDGDLGKILGRAVALLLEQVRRRKFAETRKPRKPPTPATNSPSRHIPAAIRRAVWKRDAGRCTYVSAGGRRCGAREFLEFDHVEAWERHRSHSVEGITLRCRAHNQERARRDFGERHMARFTRRRSLGPSDDEPRPRTARKARQPDPDQVRPESAERTPGRLDGRALDEPRQRSLSRCSRGRRRRSRCPSRC